MHVIAFIIRIYHDARSSELHGAGSFLRSYKFLSQSRNSLHFMEPEGSPMHSQMPPICPYPEPDQCHAIPLLEDGWNKHTSI